MGKFLKWCGMAGENLFIGFLIAVFLDALFLLVTGKMFHFLGWLQ